MEKNNTIEWGFGDNEPLNIRSKEHQDFLIEQYNRNRPIDEQVKNMQEYMKALEDNEVKHHIYVNNSRYMEFVSELADEITDLKFGGTNWVKIKDTSDDIANNGLRTLPDGTAYALTDRAKEYYLQKYDDIEEALNNTLNIYSDEHLR